MSEAAPGGGKMSDQIAFAPLKVAVLTVSDTRDEESDTSGKLLADRVTRDGHVLAHGLPGHVGDDRPEQQAEEAAEGIGDVACGGVD